MPSTPTRPAVTTEKQGAQLSEAERLAEEVRNLELEQQERIGSKLGQVGRPTFGTQAGPPPKTTKQTPLKQQQIPQQALSQIFAQMTSVGYKPTEQALSDSGNQAITGPVELSKTWLAALLIRLLKRNHIVE